MAEFRERIALISLQDVPGPAPNVDVVALDEALSTSQRRKGAEIGDGAE